MLNLVNRLAAILAPQNPSIIDCYIINGDIITVDDRISGPFAYERTAVEEWVEENEGREFVAEDGGAWQAFCDDISPEWGDPTAVTCYCEGVIVCEPGICTPVLTERERELIDLALEAREARIGR